MENVFEKAKKSYDNIMRTTQAMFEIHEEAMKGNGVDFSVESAMCELDVLIQYSMLQIALNDSNLNENDCYKYGTDSVGGYFAHLFNDGG